MAGKGSGESFVPHKTIFVLVDQVSDSWFGVALSDDGLVSTASGSSREQALRYVRGSVPSGASAQLLTDEAAGNEESAGVKAEAEREVVGQTITGAAYTRADRRNADEGFESGQVMRHITAPATDLARTWEGWGTSLKPGYEPVVVAYKKTDEDRAIEELLAIIQERGLELEDFDPNS